MLSLALVAVALLASATAAAQDMQGVAVSGQWVRALSAGLPAAGYFTLSNGSARPVRLVSASSPACGNLTLHQTVRQHTMSAMSARDPQNPMAGMPGMSSMQPVAGVMVAAHGTVSFTPGGYHLMCEQPGAGVQPGQSIAVTLRFAGGGEIASLFPVRGARGR
jgi:copper(I)-binding protein